MGLRERTLCKALGSALCARCLLTEELASETAPERAPPSALPAFVKCLFFGSPRDTYLFNVRPLYQFVPRSWAPVVSEETPDAARKDEEDCTEDEAESGTESGGETARAVAAKERPVSPSSPAALEDGDAKMDGDLEGEARAGRARRESDEYESVRFRSGTPDDPAAPFSTHTHTHTHGGPESLPPVVVGKGVGKRKRWTILNFFSTRELPESKKRELPVCEKGPRARRAAAWRLSGATRSGETSAA